MPYDGRMPDELFKSIMEDWRKEAGGSYVEPPNELCHYTSGPGLHGILSSNSIWGGNYAFMNDRSEFNYGRDLFTAMLAERAHASQDEQIRRILVAAMEPNIFEVFDLYLACFCEEPDLLSQWRGYGGQDSRYCLRFSTPHL